MADSHSVRSMPTTVAGITIPRTAAARTAWDRDRKALPSFLFHRSVRSFLWGAHLGRIDGLSVDGEALWIASLFHDLGLTRAGRGHDCFEHRSAAVAARHLAVHGWTERRIAVVTGAIVLHMQPSVTVADGAEAVLLDVATSLDVWGLRYAAVDDIRDAVLAVFPRMGLGPRFAATLQRDARRNPNCQAARALEDRGLAARIMASPWAAEDGGWPSAAAK